MRKKKDSIGGKKRGNEKSGSRQSGGVGKVVLTEEEEEALIGMIARLDGLVASNDKACIRSMVGEILTNDDDGECSDSSSSNSDSDDDKEDDKEDENIPSQSIDISLNQMNTTPLLQMSSEDLVRRLVRDDRKASKEEATKREHSKAAKKNTLKAMNLLADEEACHIVAEDKESTVFEVHQKLREPPESSQLRLSISCEGKPGPPKLVVSDRSCSIEDLVLLARNKFSVGKRYSTLVSSADPLHSLCKTSLRSLPSESCLMLSTRVLEVATPEFTCIDIDMSGKDDKKDDEDEVEKLSSDTSNPVIHVPTSTQWSVSSMTRDRFEEHAPSPRRVSEEESALLLKAFEQQRNSSVYTAMNVSRVALPVFSVKEELLGLIESNQCVVLSGETGSGKTTQTPQYIYEDMVTRGKGSEAYIICTQPRRIAAISVAERVAQERGEGVGETVGYQVRLNSRVSASTRIIYCTTGVILRRLHSPTFLNQVSHILIDEVHERQVDTDFLMAQLKQQLHLFSHVKLILMSATLQETLYCQYFACPVIYVHGRTFPVEIHYLPDVITLVASGQRSIAMARGKTTTSNYKGSKNMNSQGTYADHMARGDALSSSKLPRFDALAIAELIIRIIEHYSKKSIIVRAADETPLTGDGILVFLSGIQAIQKVDRALRQRNIKGLNAECYILHGSLSSELQRKVFKKTKYGEWKIILSTNIAETSVTVDDVTHVLDTGLTKEMRYDATSNVSSLKEVTVCKAAANQRSGRAGRVRAGHTWRLYTQEYFNSLVDFAIPEIRRIPLEEVVLQVLLLELGLPEVFLRTCIEPPSIEQIRRSVLLLLEIKAVLPKPSLPLTALGYHLAKLPVDVRLGKMMIVGCLLQCIEPILTIAATLGGKSPFSCPIDQRDKANSAHKSFKTSKFSDHLAVVNVYEKWREVKESQGKAAAYTFCNANYLSSNVLEEIHLLREHFRRYLVDAGLLSGIFDETSGEGELEDVDNDSEDGKANVVTTRVVEISSSLLLTEIVRCVLTAGLFPQIVRVCRYDDKPNKSKKGSGRQDMQPIHILEANQQEVFIHPSSLTFKELPSAFETVTGKVKEAYLVYYNKVASNKVYLHDCSLVPMPAILLFGGELSISRNRDRILVDGWIQLKCSELHAVLYKRLQREIELMLIKKVESPDEDLSARQSLVLDILSKLLE